MGVGASEVVSGVREMDQASPLRKRMLDDDAATKVLDELGLKTIELLEM